MPDSGAGDDEVFLLVRDVAVKQRELRHLRKPTTRDDYMRVPPKAAPDGDRVAFRRKVRVNPVGACLFGAYMLCAGVYGYVRLAFSMRDLGALAAYGWIVILVEAMGALCMMFYGVWLVARTDNGDVLADSPPRREYTIRVMVPCYRESLAIVSRTIVAIRRATLPSGCSRTVYLCDDGSDPDKRDFVRQFDDVVYVTGRPRDTSGSNGKSDNLNHALKMIYPVRPNGRPGRANVAVTELVCIFDADQTCSAEFFEVTLRYMDSGDDVGAVLSPQIMHNVRADCDVFNHQNVHFWEKMQPGMDALGFVSLTGTNMILRARALQECGWFPTLSVTEDWELGMKLRSLGWHCRYVPQYLAIGEAPLQIRQAFQQRSRWCKGHFQTFWSKRCPLLDESLSWFYRVMYSSTCVSYLSAGVSTPAMTLVPVITVVFGYFPISINLPTVAAATAYYVAVNAMMYHCTSAKHATALWFSNVGTCLLFWPYLKAAVTSPFKAVLGSGLTFKATAKGTGQSRGSAGIKDLWPAVALVCLSCVALVVGLLDYDVRVNAPKALALCWVAYNAVPHALLLLYAAFGQGDFLGRACRSGMALTFLSATAAVGLMWLLYPRDMDYRHAARLSIQYLEATAAPSGVYQDGLAGRVVIMADVATSSSYLAWSLLDHDDYWEERPDERDSAVAVLRHGMDFIDSGSSVNRTAYLLGDMALESASWAAYPIDDTAITYVNATSSDVYGQVIAALAAGSIVLKEPRLAQKARDMFEAAILKRGVSSQDAGARATGVPDMYWTSSGTDDLFWAATWLFRSAAARDPKRSYYYGAMSRLMDATLSELDSMEVTRDNVANAAVVHAAVQTADYRYHAASQALLWDWMCSGGATYTLLGRAWGATSPMLGDTVEVAALAATYVKRAAFASKTFRKGIACFAESQARYVLGSTRSMSLMVLFGRRYPSKTWSRIATCGAKCDPAGVMNDDKDAYPVPGALLWAPKPSDSVEDARGGNATATSLDNNRAVPLLFSALASSGAGSYVRCMQGVGGVTGNPACRKGRPNGPRTGPSTRNHESFGAVR